MLIGWVAACAGVLLVLWRTPIADFYERWYRESLGDDRSARTMTPRNVAALGFSSLVFGIALIVYGIVR